MKGREMCFSTREEKTWLETGSRLTLKYSQQSFFLFPKLSMARVHLNFQWSHFVISVNGKSMNENLSSHDLGSCVSCQSESIEWIKDISHSNCLSLQEFSHQKCWSCQSCVTVRDIKSKGVNEICSVKVAEHILKPHTWFNGPNPLNTQERNIFCSSTIWFWS